MNIKEMQYDLKFKLNKIDSSQYKNLRIPEIDWVLNESIELFVKNIAQPRFSQILGFEINQRNIDDIRTLVVDKKDLTVVKINDKTYYVELPEDYLFYAASRVSLKKNKCVATDVRCTVRSHGDLFEDSPFDNSSFEWEDINITFYEKGIKIYTDGTFEVTDFFLDYIKKPKYVHNAEDFSNTGYKALNGTLLTGHSDCDLPEHTHREIVDIAVLLITGDLIQNYQIKKEKININKFN